MKKSSSGFTSNHDVTKHENTEQIEPMTSQWARNSRKDTSLWIFGWSLTIRFPNHCDFAATEESYWQHWYGECTIRGTTTFVGQRKVNSDVSKWIDCILKDNGKETSTPKKKWPLSCGAIYLRLLASSPFTQTCTKATGKIVQTSWVQVKLRL